MDNIVDKCSDFNGFLRVFHRNPRKISNRPGKPVENDPAASKSPKSFPKPQPLHIIKASVHEAPQASIARRMFARSLCNSGSWRIPSSILSIAFETVLWSFLNSLPIAGRLIDSRLRQKYIDT